MRTLPEAGHEPVGLDVLASSYTRHVGSIVDRARVRECMRGVDAVLHAATLHKPHVATHARQDFVDTNVTGTLNLLEEAAAAGVRAFVFTSTTSTFGRASRPQQGEPAAWITEEVVPAPSNIYGVTKLAAEGLCELFHQRSRLPCLILRTSRFFPEQDDRRETREAYDDAKPEAQRAPVPARRPARRRRCSPAGARARQCARLRALHRERHDAVHPRRSEPIATVASATSAAAGRRSRNRSGHLHSPPVGWTGATIRGGAEIPPKERQTAPEVSELRFRLLGPLEVERKRRQARPRAAQAAGGARAAAAGGEPRRLDRAADRRALGRLAARRRLARRCRCTSPACARRSGRTAPRSARALPGTCSTYRRGAPT